MTRKFSLKDIAYFSTLIFLGLAITILGLFFIFGTDIKGIQNDTIRLNNFSSIKYQVEYYITSRSKFPESLQVLDKDYPQIDYGYSSSSSYRSTETKSIYKDPKTKEYYDIKYDKGSSYKLCANFETDSDKVKVSNYSFKKGYSCVEFNLSQYHQDILSGKTNGGGIYYPTSAPDYKE